jgi:hypothetical protein
MTPCPSEYDMNTINLIILGILAAAGGGGWILGRYVFSAPQWWGDEEDEAYTRK